MANFYLVEQRGVPGARLIEAERPASAINHVVDDAFSAKRVDGRELLDAAKLYEVEVAGLSKTIPAPAGGSIITIEASDAQNIADFVAGKGEREEDSE